MYGRSATPTAYTDKLTRQEAIRSPLFLLAGNRCSAQNKPTFDVSLMCFFSQRADSSKSASQTVKDKSGEEKAPVHIKRPVHLHVYKPHTYILT